MNRATVADPRRRRAIPATPGHHAVRVRGLRKEYRGAVALDSVDLDLPAGSVFGLLGPNGSGKTTLIRLLLGLRRPSAGSVELLGHPMPAARATVLPHVGALVETPGFQPHLSGRANLARYATAEPLVRGVTLTDTVAGALHRVGLTREADRPCRGYSPGMRQRLGLAAVLLAPHRLVVLDEPTNGLDPAGTRLVRELIGEWHANGTTVLVSSRLLGEVTRTCTHVAVLSAGSLVAVGELTELLEADGPALLVSTTDPPAALAALRHARLAGYLEHDRLVVDLRRDSAEHVLRALVSAGVPVTEAQRRRTGLEELFLRLTEDGP